MGEVHTTFAILTNLVALRKTKFSNGKNADVETSLIGVRVATKTQIT